MLLCEVRLATNGFLSSSGNRTGHCPLALLVSPSLWTEGTIEWVWVVKGRDVLQRFQTLPLKEIWSKTDFILEGMTLDIFPAHKWISNERTPSTLGLWQELERVALDSKPSSGMLGASWGSLLRVCLLWVFVAKALLYIGANTRGHHCPRELRIVPPVFSKKSRLPN